MTPDDGIPAPNPLPGDGDPEPRDDVGGITPGEGAGGAMQATPGVPDLEAIAAATRNEESSDSSEAAGSARPGLTEGGPTQQGEGDEPQPPGTPATNPGGETGPSQGGRFEGGA